MSRINRYILQELLVLFGFFSLILVLIYWINRAVKLFDQLISDGQSAFVFLEFTALTIPAILSSILPIASFAAAVYMYHKLSKDSELAILQSTGHSTYRILRPFLIFGILACTLQLALQHVLVPTASQTLKQRTVETTENATARLLTEGQFVDASDTATLFIQEVTPEGELINFFLHETHEDDLTTYSSKRAFLVKSETGPKLVLVDGIIQSRDADAPNLSVTRFNDFVIDVSSFLATGPVAPPGVRELTSAALLRADGFHIFSRQLELGKRLVRTVLPLITVMIGVATLMVGGFNRLGVWSHILYAFLLLVAIKMIEGVALDHVQSQQGQIWVLAAPILCGIGLFAAMILYREKPWLRAAPTEGPA